MFTNLQISALHLSEESGVSGLWLLQNPMQSERNQHRSQRGCELTVARPLAGADKFKANVEYLQPPAMTCRHKLQRES
eukprot:m.345406 g.345406  ORF g.345406 m.345406 type:complete len:78 (+) comp16557_c0_seq8:881-1114(+)